MSRSIKRLTQAQLTRLLRRLDKDADHYETLRAWMQKIGWPDNEEYRAVCIASGGLDKFRRLVRWEINERRGKNYEPVAKMGRFNGGVP